MTVSKTMKALLYSKPKECSVVEVPLPELRDNDVLVCPTGSLSKQLC